MSLIDKVSNFSLVIKNEYITPGSNNVSKLVNGTTAEDVKPLTGKEDPTEYDLYYADGTSMIKEYADNLPEGQTL